MNDEMLEIVNEDGKVTGYAPRNVIHHDNTLLHRVVHLLLFNSKGQLLLQKRSTSKDVAPGKWDTSVGGHVGPGEDIREALLREMKEELSLRGVNAEYIYSYIYKNERESELVYSFKLIHDGTISFDRNEITEVKFWDVYSITKILDTDLFSNNFKDEFGRYLDFIRMQTEEDGHCL